MAQKKFKDQPNRETGKGAEWETPAELFDLLDGEFHFTMDPACQLGHYTAQTILRRGGTICLPPPEGQRTKVLIRPARTSKKQIRIDGLASPWSGRVYLNPPYGREIGKWVAKARGEVRSGNAELVVALLPARVDTRWWQENIGPWHIVKDGRQKAAVQGMFADEVRFVPNGLKGWKGSRVKFGNAENGATFPSAVVIWRN